MLDKEKISKNLKKFVTTGQKFGFVTDGMVEELGKDLLTAPASTSKDYYGAFEGGLLANSLNIAKYAVELNKTLPEDSQVEMGSLLKVCLLHQIGKAKLFKPLVSDWHNKKGIMYEFNDELTSMGVGERSIYYGTKHGVSFTEDEYQAILNFNKGDDDKQAKMYTNTLGQILKAAIIMTGIEDKKTLKNG
jgi:hypothetical protein